MGCCNELDWTGVDQTLEHHPDCDCQAVWESMILGGVGPEVEAVEIPTKCEADGDNMKVRLVPTWNPDTAIDADVIERIAYQMTGQVAVSRATEPADSPLAGHEIRRLCCNDCGKALIYWPKDAVVSLSAHVKCTCGNEGDVAILPTATLNTDNLNDQIISRSALRML